MNAFSTAALRGYPRGGSDPLAGFRHFLAKECREWLRPRRFVTMSAVATFLALSGAMIERVRATTGDTSTPYNFDPSYNLYMVGWDSLVPLFAAFGTMALITSEREKGTLAWSLSMPLGRPALLLSKLVAAAFFLGVTAVVIPELVSVGAVRIAYGGFPDAHALLWEPLGGFAFGVFVVALNLATSTFVRGQVAVVGTTLCTVLTIPPLVGLLSKDLQRWLPTEIFGYLSAWGHGDPTHVETLIAWGAATSGLIVLALVRFNRREL